MFIYNTLWVQPFNDKIQFLKVFFGAKFVLTTSNSDQRQFLLPFTNSPAQTSGLIVSGLAFSPLLGIPHAFKSFPLLLSLTFPVPAGYLGDIILEFSNPVSLEDGVDDGGGFEFCGAAVVATGANVPCLRMVDDVQVVEGGERRVVDGWESESFWEHTSMFGKPWWFGCEQYYSLLNFIFSFLFH